MELYTWKKYPNYEKKILLKNLSRFSGFTGFSGPFCGNPVMKKIPFITQNILCYFSSYTYSLKYLMIIKFTFT